MELVVAAAEEIRQRLTRAFEQAVEDVAPRTLACALTGGATAMIFLGALKAAQVDWSRVTFFWGDERAVPPDDHDSNYGLARQMLLGPLGAGGPRAFRMPADHVDLRSGAMQYDQTLSRELGGAPLDLAILGVGDDGHVCSLFPGHRALMAEGGRVVAIEDSPKPPPRRLTLTLPFLLQTRQIWLVVMGARKLDLLQAALAGTHNSTPLDLLVRHAKHLTVFTDQAIRRG